VDDARDLSQLDLLPHHRHLIARSAISPGVALARGYRSVTTRSALLIPVRGVAGDVVLYQARPDEPRIVDGKPLKYETPAGAHMVLDYSSAKTR
jgi:hypothetical protein